MQQSQSYDLDDFSFSMTATCDAASPQVETTVAGIHPFVGVRLIYQVMLREATSYFKTYPRDRSLVLYVVAISEVSSQGVPRCGRAGSD